MEVFSDFRVNDRDLLLYLILGIFLLEGANGLFVNCFDVSLCEELCQVLKVLGHVLGEELSHLKS